MNRLKSILAMFAVAILAIACQKEPSGPQVEYLDVTPNNISGKWQLVEWDGQPLAEGTYFYIEIVRKDKKYTIWQNFGSIPENAHKVTGSYNIVTDVLLGAIIRGKYDFDGGLWAYDYEVNDLTSDRMTWVAIDDDNSFTQKFVRVSDIPVK